MEVSCLVDEVRKYCSLTKLLQKSLHDTRKTFRDINEAKCAIENNAISAEMSSLEEETVGAVASEPPCFVILGQSLQSRVALANRIFGEDFLPRPGETAWHTVMFRYGTRNRVVPLDANVPLRAAGGNASAARRPVHSWKTTVPLSELEVTEDSCGHTSVEVRANHPLLHSGAKLAIRGDTGNVLDVYTFCVRDAAPVIVYAVHINGLLEEDITLLQYMRKRDEKMSVYFVKTPAEFHWSCCETSVRPLPSSSLDSGSSPTLLKQLVELEFFTGVGGTSSEGLASRPPSELEQTLGNTLVPALFEQHTVQPPGSNDSATETNAAVVADNRLVDTCNATNTEYSSDVFYANAADEIAQLCNRTKRQSLLADDEMPAAEAGQSIYACGSSPTDVVVGDTDRPMSTLSSTLSAEHSSDVDSETGPLMAESELVDGLSDGFCSGLASFAGSILQSRLLSTVALMNTIHRRCLDTMISLAFDMAWDVICTPTRIKFARTKEGELYRSLMRVALKQQDEIKSIIQETIASEEESVLQCAASFQFSGPESLDESGEVQMPTAESVKVYMAQIQDLVIARLNAAISCKLLQLVNVLHDSYTGVLTRCLASLEQKDVDGSKSTETSDALREILNAAYHVGISPGTRTSFIKTLIAKMKQLMHGVLMRTPTSLDDAWKRRVAASVLSSLTDARCQRLAKSICAQIKDSVRRSHAVFESSLTRLEAHHNGRLKQTEIQRLSVRKEYAPRIARLALESRSLRDLILYGKLVLGPEIGRGQYGVVYSCESWAGYGPCAVKSVAPPDDRHWNDLAMEFHYTTNILEHERIVSLRGSIIDYSYGSGSSRNPAVLLIMDRYKCDLYAAIERRLNRIARLRVALDVVEAVRYLHGQGLVHRDIKLKNVLLDADNRGRLTDLGFCKPEAMMSGSIVGTPLHMAPELVTGQYDHSVDVYAFGVLFWYICAGTVRLPTHFEVCTNKDMLFTLVRKGLRPERPPDCDRDCWDLMNRCWHGEPMLRPHVGELEISLRAIYDRFAAAAAQLPQSGVSDDEARSRAASSSNEDFAEIDVNESLTTDSDFDFEDLTLQ